MKMIGIQKCLKDYKLIGTCVLLLFIIALNLKRSPQKIYSKLFIRNGTTFRNNSSGWLKHQNCYPDYYDSDIRTGWKFSILKYYSDSDLFTYVSKKPTRNTNQSAPGEMGTAVIVPPESEKLRDEMLAQENFNLFASNMVSVNRTLPDSRSDKCKLKHYPARLPKASIIIVFHNEPWSTLIRTIWSIVNRAPSSLLHEIILVDDFSSKSNLKRSLEEYVKRFPIAIKLLRMKKREGLIRARLFGAKIAKGNVLVFLDAHIECTDGWLEPLLTRISCDRSVVAVPVIGRVHSSDMSFKARKPAINGFRWSLIFNWFDIPERELKRVHYDITAPIRTPTIVGCAFAIDREFFFEIGSYDEKMNIWGSENLEMSLRVWMCGGFVEMIPCSHIGHLYRISTYSFNGNEYEIKNQNNVRLAETWMDHYKEYFYAAISDTRDINPGDLTDRLELKKKLKCKSFEWYLKNIYPESNLGKTIFLGFFRSGELCLDSFDRKHVATYSCHFSGGNQLMSMNDNNQIVIPEEKCLCKLPTNKLVTFCSCIQDDINQKWIWDKENNFIIHKSSGLCLYINLEENVSLEKCDEENYSMKWVAVPWKLYSSN